ncbi:hypothetical protein LARI1_G004489 [Lachnellula arida]|uniref:DUF4048 domain-containing protein n=1 Tax=Lachnellula arida TaxID=1316785 RepID=A0A8T9BE86_9HELO|nr:hypothetical protein LARI1_G004489 [Lachnellula arida]
MISQRTSFFPLLDHEASQFTHQTICTMESHRRRSSIDPASVESILTPGVSGQAADPPSPHIGTSPSRTYFAMDPPSQSASRHSRAMSYTPLRPNRLSLSFPVATNRNSIESARPTPSSSISNSFPSTPSEIPTPSPSDPSGFLNALASQERKVLELKEELGKAEADLTKLKRQWAVHEAHKKKAEIRHLEQLQPLQTAGAGAEGTKFNEDGTIMTRQSAEWDRRKALLTNINTKESRSRVFSGAHTRTLSLLSPERSNCPRPFPPVREATSETQSQASFPRSTTMPDTSQGITRVSTHRARPLSYQGGLTHGAKQVAEDMKTGLWTFLEDLRQATVGDEIANSAANRGIEQTSKGPIIRKSSKSSLLGADMSRGQKSSPRHSPRASSPRTWDSLTGGDSALLDAAERLLSDNQAETKARKPLPKPAKKSRTLSLAAPALDDDDDWSNWDSPAPKSPRWSGSTTVSEDPATPSIENIDDPVQIIGQSNNGGSSTPSKRDDLQWPALDKLTPGNLKRTVSTIMQEWENSLTPPPGEEGHGRRDSKQKTQEEEDDVLLMSR